MTRSEELSFARRADDLITTTTSIASKGTSKSAIVIIIVSCIFVVSISAISAFIIFKRRRLKLLREKDEKSQVAAGKSKIQDFAKLEKNQNAIKSRDLGNFGKERIPSINIQRSDRESVEEPVPSESIEKSRSDATITNDSFLNVADKLRVEGNNSSGGSSFQDAEAKNSSGGSSFQEVEANSSAGASSSQGPDGSKDEIDDKKMVLESDRSKPKSRLETKGSDSMESVSTSGKRRGSFLGRLMNYDSSVNRRSEVGIEIEEPKIRVDTSKAEAGIDEDDRPKKLVDTSKAEAGIDNDADYMDSPAAARKKRGSFLTRLMSYDSNSSDKRVSEVGIEIEEPKRRVDTRKAEVGIDEDDRPKKFVDTSKAEAGIDEDDLPKRVVDISKAEAGVDNDADYLPKPRPLASKKRNSLLVDLLKNKAGGADTSKAEAGVDYEEKKRFVDTSKAEAGVDYEEKKRFVDTSKAEAGVDYEEKKRFVDTSKAEVGISAEDSKKTPKKPRTTKIRICPEVEQLEYRRYEFEVEYMEFLEDEFHSAHGSMASVEEGALTGSRPIDSRENLDRYKDKKARGKYEDDEDSNANTSNLSISSTNSNMSNVSAGGGFSNSKFFRLLKSDKMSKKSSDE